MTANKAEALSASGDFEGVAYFDAAGQEVIEDPARTRPALAEGDGEGG